MLTPEDIEKKEFTKGVRGYKDTEVDAFLDEVIEEFKDLIAENRSLKDRILRYNSDIDKLQKDLNDSRSSYEDLQAANEELSKQYRELESSLYTTLESAKTLMSDISESANKKAEITISSAEAEAEEILRDARKELDGLKQQEKIMKDRVISARMRFQYLLESEMKTLKMLDLDVLGEKVSDEFDDFINSLEAEGKN
jgi:cell division initiation protein